MTNHNVMYTAVVIGAGLAGLCAALEASQWGRVLLVDKGRVGGNSAKATSGINAVGPKDTVRQFYQDTAKSSQQDYSGQLVQTLVNSSQAALDWLRERGLNFGPAVALGGHSTRRSWRTVDGSGLPLHVGSTLVGQLRRHCEERPQITIREGVTVQELIQQDGRVVGVKLLAENSLTGETIRGNRVIITTGGFSYMNDMIRQYHPQWTALGTTNGSFATGDGIYMARKIGASVVGMSHIQLHPTGFLNPREPNKREQILAPEILRALGGILVNGEGRRFTGELAYRHIVVADMFRHCHHKYQSGQPVAYLVVDQKVVDQFGSKMFGFYLGQGLFVQCPGIGELAQNIGDPTIIGQLLAELQGHREGAPPLEPPYYVAEVSPTIHYTMGGLQINEKAQVLDEAGQPIPGLYAAGEVTGGVHGINRLAGNSLLECVVYGRLAGQE